MELWTAVGYRFSVHSLVRGVAFARLSTIYADARRGFLVGRGAAITSFRRHASVQPWRIADRDLLCRGRRSAVLLKPVANQVALLGGGTARWLGLVSVLSLWSTRQRPGGERTPVCHSPFGRPDMEWRPDRAGRQSLRAPNHGHHRAGRVDRVEPKWAA